jgi:enoyl-CoA hydratase/3-hydroxyacyl-CoA dehydrogenase
LARPLESEAAERAAERAREQHEKRFKNVDHPEACLEAVLTGVREGAAAGLARERALFTELLTKPAARGLIHLFFAERAAAKVPGVTDQKRQGRPIERVGVLGGGTMGTGIATALLTAGFSVQLVEADIDRAQAARSRIEGLLARAEHKGRASAEQTEQRRRALSVADDLSAVFDADFVIEAATEERALKRRLFSELLEHTPADVTLASNTSTIDIDEIADGTERVVGMHFFSPAHVMRLCEVVRGTRSSDDRLRDTLWLAKRLGKVAVTVRSCPGFLVNRVFMPYSQATGLLIDRGIDPYRIDAVLEAFGMPMGPCKMSDLAGIDVGLLAGAVLDQAYADRAYRSPLRRILVDAGRLGQKTGAGHYRYVDGRAQQDPELSRFVAEARQEAGAPAPVELSDEQIVDALILGVVNEASRALSEDVVQRAGDVDVAAALGMGFPAYRGGPMFWAQQRGTEAIKRTSSALAERFDHPLFVPTG